MTTAVNRPIYVNSVFYSNATVQPKPAIFYFFNFLFTLDFIHINELGVLSIGSD